MSVHLDDSCRPGDRVHWRTLVGQTYEGVLIEWDNGTAIVRLDDGRIKAA